MKVYVISEENQSSCCYGVINIGVKLNKEDAIKMAECDFNKRNNKGNEEYSKQETKECLDEWRIIFKINGYISEHVYLITEYEVET